MNDMKKCAKCKEYKPYTEYSKGQNSDGYQSYCRPCNYIQNTKSKIKYGDKPWHRDGYATEKEHFNAALEHYAELFNLPQLTKYKQ